MTLSPKKSTTRACFFVRTALVAEKSTDTELEDELQLLSSSNTTEYDAPPTHGQEDSAVAVDRANRAVRPPTSGRRYTGSRNTTTTSDRSGPRARLRQRPGAARRPQKGGGGGGRQRSRNRGRKFRGGKGRNRGLRPGTETGAGGGRGGSGRRLNSKNFKAKNRTMVVGSDREQADATYNAQSMGGSSTSVEGQEELTNTLEPASLSLIHI